MWKKARVINNQSYTIKFKPNKHITGGILCLRSPVSGNPFLSPRLESIIIILIIIVIIIIIIIIIIVIIIIIIIMIIIMILLIIIINFI